MALWAALLAAGLWAALLDDGKDVDKLIIDNVSLSPSLFSCKGSQRSIDGG